MSIESLGVTYAPWHTRAASADAPHRAMLAETTALRHAPTAAASSRSNEPTTDYGAEALPPRQPARRDRLGPEERRWSSSSSACRRPSWRSAATSTTGGVYEGKWLGGGLSHLLEHLVAGGSNERRTEEQNRDLLQQIGNNSNAYTTDDHTAFFVNTTTDTPGARRSTWSPAGCSARRSRRRNIAREYEVVQRELEKDKGEPDWRLLRADATEPLSRQPRARAGDRLPGSHPGPEPRRRVHVLQAGVSAEQHGLRRRRRSRAGGDAGGRAEVRQATSRPAGRSIARHRRRAAGRCRRARSSRRSPSSARRSCELAFPSVELDHPDLYALDLLATVLGGGDSSILIEEIRDKQQLVDRVLVSDSTPSLCRRRIQRRHQAGPGQAQATPARPSWRSWRRPRPSRSTPSGSSAPRRRCAPTAVNSRQTAETIAESLADGYISTGDVHFLDHYTDRIQKVDAKQLQAVARKYFKTGELITTVMLPEEYVGAAGLPKAQDILRRRDD